MGRRVGLLLSLVGALTASAGCRPDVREQDIRVVVVGLDRPEGIRVHISGQDAGRTSESGLLNATLLVHDGDVISVQVEVPEPLEVAPVPDQQVAFSGPGVPLTVLTFEVYVRKRAKSYSYRVQPRPSLDGQLRLNGKTVSEWSNGSIVEGAFVAGEGANVEFQIYEDGLAPRKPCDYQLRPTDTSFVWTLRSDMGSCPRRPAAAGSIGSAMKSSSPDVVNPTGPERSKAATKRTAKQEMPRRRQAMPGPVDSVQSDSREDGRSPRSTLAPARQATRRAARGRASDSGTTIPSSTTAGRADRAVSLGGWEGTEEASALKRRTSQDRRKGSKEIPVAVECAPMGWDIWVDGIKRQTNCRKSSMLFVSAGMHKFALRDPDGNLHCPDSAKRTFEVPVGGLASPVRLNGACGDCFLRAKERIGSAALQGDDLQCLRDISKDSSRWVLAQQILARSFQHRKQWDRAADTLKVVAATEQGRVNGEIYAQLAEIYYEGRRYDDAVGAYSIAWRYRTTLGGDQNRRTALMVNLLRVNAGAREKLYFASQDSGIGDPRKHREATDAYRRLRSIGQKTNDLKLLEEARKGLERLDSEGGT